MVHQAVFAFVHEFNRVFHRDDVVFAVFVRVIHDRRQRGGFAGTGRAGDHDQAVCNMANFLNTAGRGRFEFVKILERKHPARNLPEHRGDAVFLVEEIDAETGDIRDFITEIHVAGFFKHLDFVIRGDFVEHRLESVAFQRRIIHALEFAVDAQHRRIARGHVQIGGLLLEHQVEKGINFCHKPFPLTRNSL